MMGAFGPAEGVMFDLDGTLILSDHKLGQYRLLPGAIELLEELDRRGLPFVALTHGSAYPAQQQAPRLAALGLPIRADRLFTPNSVAIGLFKGRGVERVLVLGTEGVRAALEQEGVATCVPGDEDGDKADAVYVAWHPDCSMTDIHVACTAILNGAAFYCASDVPFFATQSGPAFGYSCAIAGAIVRVTGVEPELTGKPSQHALNFIAGQLGVSPQRVAVIGDDPRVEIEMAIAGRAIGIGVTTGTTSREQWAAQDEVRRPHHVIDSLA
ncbi:MAG: HAD hydrolase-like protein [Caulobacteraceae bacterium]|nr:HAD hydrolase-like protein [Caulobacteraceae bacterium]